MDFELAVVRVLAEEWGEWQHEPDFPFSADHCINGTRVALTVLDKLGVHGKPVSVSVFVANRFAIALMDKGIAPPSWPDHAWSIGVNPNEEPRGPKAWNGHLVAEGDGWTLDISAQQFHRPGRIEVPKPIVLAETIPFDGPAIWEDGRGQLYRLERTPENNRWRTAPGWGLTPNNNLAADTLLRRVMKGTT